MTTIYKSEPSEKAKIILASLQRAVTAELDHKKRLGHYAVLWDGERPIFEGDDAPISQECPAKPKHDKSRA